MTCATFKLLSPIGISSTGEEVNFEDLKSKNQFFDVLWHVEKCFSGRKKEGLLLCSHRSEWPPELVKEANFLAGCRTPEEFADDPRLVFGYTPDSYIMWELDKKEKTVFLCLQESYAGVILGEDPDDEDEDGDWEEDEILYAPFTTPDLWIEPSDRIKRSLTALSRLASRQAAEEGEEFGWRYLYEEGILRLRWGADRAAHLMWMFNFRSWDWLPFEPPRDVTMRFQHRFIEIISFGQIVQSSPAGEARGFYAAVDIDGYVNGWLDEWGNRLPDEWEDDSPPEDYEFSFEEE